MATTLNSRQNSQESQGSIEFCCTVESFSGRLDLCLSREYDVFRRSQYRHRVLSARINGKGAKPASQVAPGDILSIEYLPEASTLLEAESIPLNVVYEDSNVLVVNKERGMVVHPGAGNHKGTLVNAFLHHCRADAEHWGWAKATGFADEAVQSTDAEQLAGAKQLHEAMQALRPGIVHRLDKETTGVIILAKNTETLDFLAGQFRDRTTHKTYLAVVHGHVHSAGEVRGYIRRKKNDRMLFAYNEHSGKPAHSEYTPVARTSAPLRASLLRLHPITGRTHQLRVHTKRIGHSIIGDRLYGGGGGQNRVKLPRLPEHLPAPQRPPVRQPETPTALQEQLPQQFQDPQHLPLLLHALSLRICLPGEQSPRTFTAELPQDMQDALRVLNLPEPPTL